MRIETIKLKNYKALQDVTIDNLGPMSVFVGANGAGKSTLFDVFGFLHDALVYDARVALTRRGGYREVVSRNQAGPITIELKFREDDDGPLVTYMISVGLDENGLPVVEREVLKYRRGQNGRPWHFLDYQRGRGQAVVNEVEYNRGDAEERREEQSLGSPYLLAVKGLGQLEKFKVVSSLRRLIERWYVSDFHIADARPSQDMAIAEHLSTRGDNLALVARYMYEHAKPELDKVLAAMARRVPGIMDVRATETTDGRIVLQFQDGSFKDPFSARFVSDGTIKMFAYLLMLHDPDPHPLLCVEEPENQLHPELLAELAEEFREYSGRGGQVMISTHSPSLLNAARVEEVYWMKKVDGYTKVIRAADEENIRALVESGDQLGWLWHEGLLKGAGPR